MSHIDYKIDFNYSKLMCAKVTSPLLSITATGSIGRTLVYFSHLGRNVVRGLVTPRNPRSATQGDARLLLGALGRAASGVLIGGMYQSDARTIVPAGQTWVSDFIRSIVARYGTGATGVAALNTAYEAHTATNWETAATGIGLADLTILYASSTGTSITAGAMLYALAQAAFDIRATHPTLYNRAPYTTALASWDDAMVTAFVTDLTT